MSQERPILAAAQYSGSPAKRRLPTASADQTRPDRKCERQKTKDGALSRFGLEVGRLVRRALIQRVSKGDVKYARKLTHSRTVIVLDYAGTEMAFIYSGASKEIVSFLPPDAPETADWRNSQSAALALFRPAPSRPGGACK
jgi:hypothetical protein